MNSRKKGMTLVAKQRTAGWLFLAPASIMIAVMSFYPMIRAFIISLQTGAGASIPAVYCKYVSLSDHSGADHADTGNSSGTAFK